MGEECMFNVIENMDTQILLGISFVSVFTAVLFENNKNKYTPTHPIKGLELNQWSCLTALGTMGPSHQAVQVCTVQFGCHLHRSP